VSFWFTPADIIGLGLIRFLAGLLFIAWLLPFAGQVQAVFGLQGWFDAQAYTEAAGLQAIGASRLGDPTRLSEVTLKPASWSILYLCAANPTALEAAYWVSLAIVALFTLGFWTRLTALASWLVVASFTASPVTNYEGDTLLAILAFYLMVGYLLLGQRQKDLPLTQRLFGSAPAWLFRRPLDHSPLTASHRSVGANLALRLLQIHLAIVFVTSGLHKLQFGDWWAGLALWYPVFPPFGTTLDQIRSHAPHAMSYLTILSIGAYAILAWQIGFPLFAWRPRLRVVLLGGAAIGWLGTAFLFKMPIVGPAILIGCLSFLTPTEWHRIAGWLTVVPGLAKLLPAPVPETGQ
jgi:hypothetical protein